MKTTMYHLRESGRPPNCRQISNDAVITPPVTRACQCQITAASQRPNSLTQQSQHNYTGRVHMSRAADLAHKEQRADDCQEIRGSWHATQDRLRCFIASDLAPSLSHGKNLGRETALRVRFFLRSPSAALC